MTGKNIVLEALSGRLQDRPPFWFMRQAGRSLPEYRALRADAGSFLELCYNPALAAEATLQPIRRFDMDAAILFADILLVPQGLGVALDYRQGEGPVLSTVRSPAEIAALDLAGLHDRVAPVYETVRRVRAELAPEKALIGFAGAPWTVATYMVEGGGSADHARTRQWSYQDPAAFQSLIDLLVEATVEYLGAQVRAGADAVQLFDTWAGILSETGFRQWSIAPTKAVVAGLRAEFPDLPIIGFPRQAGPRLPDYVRETGVSAVGLDFSVPLDWARTEIQPHVAVQGNLDPALLVAGGEAMLRQARVVRETLRSGAFIFNLGHGIMPETPVEHVAALADLLRQG